MGVGVGVGDGDVGGELLACAETGVEGPEGSAEVLEDLGRRWPPGLELVLQLGLEGGVPALKSVWLMVESMDESEDVVRRSMGKLEKKKEAVGGRSGVRSWKEGA